MRTPEISTLPKWAQEKINHLEGALTDATGYWKTKALDAAAGDNGEGRMTVSIGSGVGERRGLPSTARIRFIPNPRKQEEFVEIYFGGDEVVFYSGQPVAIRPKVANVFSVSVER